MKKEKSFPKDGKKTDIRGDTAVSRVNQVRYTIQVPFLCLPVRDPFKKNVRSNDSLYRVIKLK